MTKWKTFKDMGFEKRVLLNGNIEFWRKSQGGTQHFLFDKDYKEVDFSFVYKDGKVMNEILTVDFVKAIYREMENLEWV